METVPIPEPAPERVRRFDLQANRWRWWLVTAGQWEPEPDAVRVTVRTRENVIDVWDGDDLALSLDFTEARQLVADLSLILTTFSDSDSDSPDTDGGEQS